MAIDKRLVELLQRLHSIEKAKPNFNAIEFCLEAIDLQLVPIEQLSNLNGRSRGDDLIENDE